MREAWPSPPPPALQPGDCVSLNAANSAVGQMVIQLASLLRLRTVALVSDEAGTDFAKTAEWLTHLGATVVLRDRGSLRVRVWKRRRVCVGGVLAGWGGGEEGR